MPTAAPSLPAAPRALPEVPPICFAEQQLPIRPWADPLIDTLGFDPRSHYVERFWLPTLGPSTTWLLRRIAAGFDRQPDGFDLPLPDTARSLGLGDKQGRHSPFARALFRIVQFDMARAGQGALEVRRFLPPLNRRQIVRLPDALRAAHEAWQAARVAAAADESTCRRARALAITMLELDPDAGTVEQRLISWGVPAVVAQQAARWAWERHVAAARAAADDRDPA
jgi:hypothetical protein